MKFIIVCLLVPGLGCAELLSQSYSTDRSRREVRASTTEARLLCDDRPCAGVPVEVVTENKHSPAVFTAAFIAELGLAGLAVANFPINAFGVPTSINDYLGPAALGTGAFLAGAAIADLFSLNSVKRLSARPPARSCRAGWTSTCKA